MRLANAATNGGAEILRRGYSYNDGVNFTAERWPPWRQGMEYDAGLLFVCYQRDPRTGFIKIFENMAKFDMLNQFVTHTGGGLFACPGGVREGEFIGQRLFSAGLTKSRLCISPCTCAPCGRTALVQRRRGVIDAAGEQRVDDVGLPVQALHAARQFRERIDITIQIRE